MKKLILLGIVLVIVGGYLWWVGTPTFNQTKTTSRDSTIESTDVTTTEEATDKPPSSTMAKTTVEIKGFAFTTPTITIKVGESVSWTNNDLVGHSATADDGSFDTGILAQNESGAVTFSKAGTYQYHCTPHPNMKGTVIVK